VDDGAMQIYGGGARRRDFEPHYVTEPRSSDSQTPNPEPSAGHRVALGILACGYV
jgi:hypothetical protein